MHTKDRIPFLHVGDHRRSSQVLCQLVDANLVLDSGTNNGAVFNNDETAKVCKEVEFLLSY